MSHAHHRQPGIDISKPAPNRVSGSLGHSTEARTRGDEHNLEIPGVRASRPLCRQPPSHDVPLLPRRSHIKTNRTDRQNIINRKGTAPKSHKVYRSVQASTDLQRKHFFIAWAPAGGGGINMSCATYCFLSCFQSKTQRLKNGF